MTVRIIDQISILFLIPSVFQSSSLIKVIADRIQKLPLFEPELSLGKK
jgi:hypothetical protein